MRVLYCGVKSGEKCSKKIRQFCLALHYYSPRAYEFVRKTFHNHLPHSKTIQNWYANSDLRGDPEIQGEHMELLRKIAQGYQNKHHRRLMCSLVFYEMNIRQQVCWLPQQMTYSGFINNEDNPENDENIIAKQVIAFVLNGIDVNFEFPVAYYFIDSLNTTKRRNLVYEIIEAITRCEVKITNITFDGCSTNVPMCNMLGADLNVQSTEFQPFIFNPVNNERIYIILDPCHMLKVVRNTLAAKKVIFDEQNNKIEWRFIESLYHYFQKNDLRTHKLTKRHMDWLRNAMNVRLANQTLSESVANSIQFLAEQNIPEFQGSEATVKFIRRINTLFDIFNTKDSKNTNIFKRAMSLENKRIIFDFFNDSITFLKTLKIETEYYVKAKGEKKAERKFKIVSLLKSRNKAAFRGFIIDMRSVMAMFVEYIEKKQFLESIPTYNLLQDVIELMFGRIRACGGFNNNPNIQQFKGAFRKIQCNMKLDLSNSANCRVFDMDLPDDIFYSNIYFVTSKRPKIFMDENLYEKQKDQILDELNAVEMFDAMENNQHLLNGNSKFMTAYIASSIEKKIMQSNSFHCDVCRLVFNNNEKANAIDSELLSLKPCVSTVEICNISEIFFKLYDINESRPRFDLRVLYCLIFRAMNFDLLYPNSKFECDRIHKYQFIKCIVGQYISTRASHISKQKTFDKFPNIIRQQFHHLILYKGQ